MPVNTTLQNQQPAQPTSAPPAARAERLPHFPVTFFAIVMGLGGTSVAWTRAATFLGAVLTMPIALIHAGLSTLRHAPLPPRAAK